MSLAACEINEYLEHIKTLLNLMSDKMKSTMFYSACDFDYHCLHHHQLHHQQKKKYILMPVDAVNLILLFISIFWVFTILLLLTILCGGE